MQSGVGVLEVWRDWVHLAAQTFCSAGDDGADSDSEDSEPGCLCRPQRSVKETDWTRTAQEERIDTEEG